MAIIFIFTHLLFKSIAFQLCVFIYFKSRRIFSSSRCSGYLTPYTPSSTLQLPYSQVQSCYPTSLLHNATGYVLYFSAPIFHFPVENWRPLFIQFYCISLSLYASESNFSNLVYCLYFAVLCSLLHISQTSFV